MTPRYAVQNKPTVYCLDRPGAWGRFGLGILLVLIPLTLMVAFSIPGVFRAVFPNAPRERDFWTTAFLAAVAVGFMGVGVFLLYTAIRTLRDRAPKLEFNEAGIIDHRGRTTIEWRDVVGVGFSVERTGDRIQRAVVTLTVRDASGGHEVEIDLRGLSQPPESIFAQLKRIRGLG
jgi:hypothetical protein